MDSKIKKITIFVLFVVLALSMILPTASCDKINLEIFGIKPDENTGSGHSETEDNTDINNTQEDD